MHHKTRSRHAPRHHADRGSSTAAAASSTSTAWRLRIPALAVLVAGSSLATAGAGPAMADSAGFAPGRILVTPKAGVPPARLNLALAGAGAWSARRITSHGLHIAEVEAGTELATLNRLARHEHLESVALDHRLPPAAITNDPLLGSAWQLSKIGATSAWDTTQGAGVTIAILDSGVDPNHPDLKPNLVAGWNFYSGNADTSDVYGHGTMVAGVAAAASNNGVGAAGVAPSAKIMPIRVTDAARMGYVSAIAQGLSWAADHGARVANVSFQVAGNSTIQSAAQYMQSKGGLVFVGAGNTGALDSSSPSASLVVVASTESNDTRSSYSSYGSSVDLAAPGGSLYTTLMGGGYGPGSGTSYASPVAAGAAALLFAARPALTPANVESLLGSTAVDLGTAGSDNYFGAGRINVAAAMAAALTLGTSADTTAPTVSITAPTANATVGGLVSIALNAADNVGVVRVDLLVNGTLVASDTAAPFAFVWDSSSVQNGMASLALEARDAAGNRTLSASVAVNVANASADTTPPVVAIRNPGSGSTVSGTAAVTGNADDNLGAAGVTQTLSIDGKVVASAVGGVLSYNWNTKKAGAGSHVLTLVGKDRAGNSTSTSSTVVVGR